MDIYFRTKKLRKSCASTKAMAATWGQRIARKLEQRFSELQAAESLADISHLPPPRCHELSGDRAGQLSVDLGHPYRLLFIPAHDPVPMKEDGGLDWAAVTAIEIVDIADTH